MRAQLWWIDRWRKSTAYTDMTLEEQGAYRNLLDEVVLREDGVIPADSMARAAGDAAAYARVRDKILKWMKWVPGEFGGWTNETALEIKAESERRSRVQRDKANKRWHSRDAAAYAPASAAGYAPAMPPEPEPDKEPDKEPEAIESVVPREKLKPIANQRISALRAEKSPRNAEIVSWSKEACELWIARFEGTAPGGPIGKALKPLVTRHGWDEVRTAWKTYLDQVEPEYASAARFAQTYGRWSGRVAPNETRPRSQAERIDASVRKTLEEARLAKSREDAEDAARVRVLDPKGES